MPWNKCDISGFMLIIKILNMNCADSYPLVAYVTMLPILMLFELYEILIYVKNREERDELSRAATCVLCQVNTTQ